MKEESSDQCAKGQDDSHFRAELNYELPDMRSLAMDFRYNSHYTRELPAYTRREYYDI